jgi:hypothetical protein
MKQIAKDSFLWCEAVEVIEITPAFSMTFQQKVQKHPLGAPHPSAALCLLLRRSCLILCVCE